MRHIVGEPQEFTAEVVHDADQFAGLAAEWDSLYQASPRATPFQSHAWVYAWSQAYDRSRSLWIVLVRDRTGRLVAAAPLHRRRRGGVRVLEPLGGAQTDFMDVLLAEHCLSPSAGDAAMAALAECLRAIGGWDVLDLPEVRCGAAAELLFRAWPGGRWSAAASTCMELHSCSFEHLLAKLPSKSAREARRRLRRADSLDIASTEVTCHQVREGVADLIRLHAARWQGRGINPEHTRPRFSRHLATALASMVEQGQAVLTRITLDGQMVAVTLDLVGHDMVCGYLTGVEPSVYQRIDVTTYVIRHELRRMTERGLSVFNMLRGREPYKEHWRPVVMVNRRLLLGRPGNVLCRPFAWAVLLTARASAVARDQGSWAHALHRRARDARRRAWVRRPAEVVPPERR